MENSFNLPIIYQAGGIVYVNKRIAIRRTKKGEWVFPKGHIEANEDPEVTAIREIAEETGLEAKIELYLGINEILLANKILKVHMYLMANKSYLPSWPFHLGKDVFLVDARDVSRILTFQNQLKFWQFNFDTISKFIDNH